MIAIYQALYRKWRPRRFEDVVGQEHVTRTLQRQAQAGRLSHAYLFTGTRGTGKTSCAKILARAVNCEHPVNGDPCNQCPSCVGIENGSILDVLELDAASNNGVDQVRALRDEAVYTPAAVKKRVYIVDEVHMLSMAAFNALLKILEEPPAHLMFILATTELHKVPATIKSRCQQFAFKRILPEDIAARLSYVAEQEGMALAPEGAALLARLADGGLRDALSLLDQCAGASGTIGEREILDALGLAGNLETARLMGQIGAGDTAGALARLSGLYSAGKEVGSVLNELSALARDLLVRQTAPGASALLTGGYEESVMAELIRLFPASRLVQALERLQRTIAELPRSANRRTDTELCLIRLCDPRLDESIGGLSARLTRLEERLASGAPVPAASPAPEAPPAPVPEPAPIRTPPPEPEEERPPLPEEPGERVFQAPEPEPAPEPKPMLESPPPRKQAAEASDTFWHNLVPALRGRVPAGDYPYLSNPRTVQGRLDEARGLLTLWVDSDFTGKLIGKEVTLKAVGQTATVQLGQPVRCRIQVGRPPSASPARPVTAPPVPAAPADDKLERLLERGARMGGILTEE